jgi:hypothetical protein
LVGIATKVSSVERTMRFHYPQSETIVSTEVLPRPDPLDFAAVHAQKKRVRAPVSVFLFGLEEIILKLSIKAAA